MRNDNRDTYLASDDVFCHPGATNGKQEVVWCCGRHTQYQNGAGWGGKRGRGSRGGESGWEGESAWLESRGKLSHGFNAGRTTPGAQLAAAEGKDGGGDASADRRKGPLGEGLIEGVDRNRSQPIFHHINYSINRSEPIWDTGSDSPAPGE